MKALILRLLFGADPMVSGFARLMTIRRKAISEDLRRRRLREDRERIIVRLEASSEKVLGHQREYADVRRDIESSYRLELQ